LLHRSNYYLFKVSGNFTLNNTKRLPNLYGFLWKGKPFSKIVIRESGLMTSPGVLFTLNDVSSKNFTTKSQPVNASRREISFSINKSAPFLLKTL